MLPSGLIKFHGEKVGGGEAVAGASLISIAAGDGGGEDGTSSSSASGGSLVTVEGLAITMDGPRRCFV